MIKDYKPLHQKYRPQNFNSLVGQESIVLTLKEAISTNRIAPAYLFSGPRGTGKTSSARILARSLNCIQRDKPTIEPCGQCELCKTISIGSALDVIEIDAASNTGVDNIRELIEKSQFSPVKARWKVYVIDECHMLSTAAFNALLKTLEEPPKKVVFILATTDPQRVLPTILSRCQRFDFRRISIDNLKSHLAMIASKETISIEDNALEIIARHAQGGLRDAESMLDQLSLLPPPINENSVWKLLGVAPENELLELVSSLTQEDPISTLKICRNLLELGREPISILQGFASILRDLVIKIAAPDQPELCSISRDSQEKLTQIAYDLDLDKLYRWQAELKGAENQLRHSLQPRLWLEVLLLGLLSEPKLNIPNQEKIIKSVGHVSEISNSNKQTYKEKVLTKPIKEVIQSFQPKEEEQLNNIKEETNNSENLKESWQKILASLELPSTRMLLSQQGQLIRISDNSVEIEVSSSWMSMIQSRKILIEEAIAKALDHPRDLILNSQKEIPIKEKDIIKNKIDLKETNNNKVSKENISANESKNKDDLIKQPIKKDNTQSTNTKKGDAENLANFFNGKIVELE